MYVAGISQWGRSLTVLYCDRRPVDKADDGRSGIIE
jgi:hypothetical protein